MGHQSERGDQVSKFQEGLDGNVMNAYLNAESDLHTTANNRYLTPAAGLARYNFGTGGFGISVFIDVGAALGTITNMFGGGYDIELSTNIGGGFVGFKFGTPAGTVLSNAGVSLVPNGKTHLVISYDGSNIRFYANGRLFQTTADPNAGQTIDLSAITEQIILNDNSKIEALDGGASHLSWFNRPPTPDEIEYICENVGDLPTTLKAYCVSYYPLTERYGYKLDGVIDAALIAKHANLNAGDRAFWDSVEMFNYNKSLLALPILTANHAVAVNYTDDELGAIEPATQSVKNDFYKKDLLQPFGLLMNTEITPNKRIEIIPAAPYSTTNNNFSVFLEATFDEVLNNHEPFTLFNNNGANAWWDIRTFYNPSGFNILITMIAPLSCALTVRVPPGSYNTIDSFKILIEKSTDDANNFNIYAQQNGVIRDKASGTLLPVSISTGTLLGNDLANYTFGSILSGYRNPARQYNGLIQKALFIDGLLTAQERNDLLLNDINPASTIDGYEFQKTSNTGVLSLAGEPITFTGFPAPFDRDKWFLEKQTLLPEIKTAFYFGETRWFQIENFFPTKEKGYTTIYCYSLDVDRDFKLDNGNSFDVFISNRSNGFKIIYGEGGTRQMKLGASVPFTYSEHIVFDMGGTKQDSINTIAFAEKYVDVSVIEGIGYINGGMVSNTFTNTPIKGWDDLPGDTYIGKDDILPKISNSYFHHLSIWKGVMTPLQIKRIVNNTLLANVNINSMAGQGIDSVLYLNPNIGAFSEDGVNVLLQDYSPINHVVKSMGLTGATSADKLADVPNHLNPINSLR